MPGSARMMLLACAALLAGCRQDMHDQPRYKPLQSSRFFTDGRSGRQLVEGTVPRGGLRSDAAYYYGRRTMAVRAASAPMQPAGTAAQPSPAPAPAAGTPPRLGQQAALPATFDPDLVTEFPMPVTRSLLERGRDRFNIFCTPCHGYTGRGNGMIVQRGLVGPKSFHLERLKSAPVGHFFEVITNGFGAMYSYAQRIPVQDRWAIVAYIRALQLSQGATLNDVPETERGRLGAPPPGREAMPGRTP